MRLVYFGFGRVVTEEEKSDEVPSNFQKPQESVDVIDLEEADKDGSEDPLSPVSARERRIATARRVPEFKQQHDRADQVDQAAAEDHSTTDAHKVSQLLRSQDDGVTATALQRLHAT